MTKAKWTVSATTLNDYLYFMKDGILMRICVFVYGNAASEQGGHPNGGVIDFTRAEVAPGAEDEDAYGFEAREHIIASLA